ncbi:MAG: ABC transporter ATP-binding protein [Caldilineaceae bacterium]
MSTDTNLIGAKLRLIVAQFPFLMRALRLVWNAAPRWTLAWLILLILQGLLPAASVYLTRVLVDNLVIALRADAAAGAFQSVWPIAVIMALIMLLVEILRYAANYVRTVQAELIRDHISSLIHAQSVAVDMAFYDMPEYHDRLYRAQYQALDRPLTLLENLGGFLQNGLTMLAMLAVLLPYGAWLPLALLVSSLPAFYTVLTHRMRLYHWQLKNTETERRTWYYNWLLTDRSNAAELRIFDLGRHFQSLFQKVRHKLRSELFQLAWNQGRAELTAAAAALGVTGLTMLWMLRRTVMGFLTLGDLALFYQAFNQGQRLMAVMLENLGEIYSNSLFLSDLFEFLALEPQVREPAQPEPMPPALQDGIRFEQVTFHYPGDGDGQRVALRDFDLHIPAGAIAAIVGANGAGKSTLIKLLCRFYDPAAGRILLDGCDLRRFSLRDLRRHFTILFQEPVNYQDTALENITLGDLAIELDLMRVQNAARSAGADGPIARLPHSFDTLLGKWFKGGAELSVGEWQRLALARAYWRQAPILILDEPTSAMDPWAEHDWLQRFRTLASGRTALIITHRFTTAMYADVIHVMDEGRVIEAGSHAELLALGGRYAQSWRAQMQSAHGRDDESDVNVMVLPRADKVTG